MARSWQCGVGAQGYEEALAAYDKALAIKPDVEGAWIGRSNVFTELGRYDEAFIAFDKAVSNRPDLEGIEGLRLLAKMNLCNWDNLDEEIGRLTAAIRLGKANSSPFALLSLTDSPDDQLSCARTWVRAKLPHVSKTRAGGESEPRQDSGRICFT